MAIWCNASASLSLDLTFSISCSGACRVSAFEVEDYDARALCGEHFGGGESEAVEAGAAGDECDVISEKH